MHRTVQEEIVRVISLGIGVRYGTPLPPLARRYRTVLINCITGK